MANVTKEKIAVKQLSKYGFQNEQGVYVNWGKALQEDKSRAGEIGKVVPGLTFEMDIYTAASGKQYVNRVGEQIGAPAKKPVSVTPSATPKATTFVASKSSEMSKDEWAAKDLRISRQGVIQAAVQAVAPLVALEHVFEEADKLATQMLEFVHRK